MNALKYIIIVLFIGSLGSVFLGYVANTEYSQKLIGFGVAVLFILAFPLFSFYRWKNKDLKDYMLTKENLEKMRENQKRKKN